MVNIYKTEKLSIKGMRVYRYLGLREFFLINGSRLQLFVARQKKVMIKLFINLSRSEAILSTFTTFQVTEGYRAILAFLVISFLGR